MEKKPQDKLPTNYIFKVKNSVIFEKPREMGTNEKINLNDKCIHKLTEDNIPKITLYNIDNETLLETCYLYNYIETGDLYDEENGFRKTVHGDDGDSEISVQEYFRELCLKELNDVIVDIIKNNKGYSYFASQVDEEFNYTRNPLGYMLSELSELKRIEVKGVEGIELTPEIFNTMKDNVITNECKKAANEKALELGANIKNISIELE